MPLRTGRPCHPPRLVPAGQQEPASRTVAAADADGPLLRRSADTGYTCRAKPPYRTARYPAAVDYNQLAVNLLDAKSLISSLGAIGLIAIIFAETGLLVGFFFPGDSLLIIAGVAASNAASSVLGDGAKLPIAVLLVGAPVAAVAGPSSGT